MSLLDTFKSLVGASRARVELDGPDAPGSAEAAVALLIADLRSSVPMEPRGAPTDPCLEAVTTRGHLPACEVLLAAVLGEPAKPFGQRARFAGPLRAMVDSEGGIEKDQCLYLCRHEDGRIAFASLWPWSDGAKITLKVGVYGD